MANPDKTNMSWAECLFTNVSEASESIKSGDQYLCFHDDRSKTRYLRSIAISLQTIAACQAFHALFERPWLAETPWLRIPDAARSCSAANKR